MHCNQLVELRFSIIVWKISLNIPSISSVYSCLFSLVNIVQSQVHIRACKFEDPLIWNLLANRYSAIMIVRNWDFA